jgi:hypothetical protein
VGEVKNFLTHNDEIRISNGKGGKKTISSFPMLWDEIEALKINPIKVFTNEEIAAHMASGAKPPEPYPWRSKSRKLTRIVRSRGGGNGSGTKV